MSELKDNLENFCKIDGVKGAYLATAEGKLIEKSVKGDEVQSFEELIHRSIEVALESSEKLQKDALNQSYIEFEDLSMTSIILENGSILTILSASGVNLGRLRLEIKKYKKVIESLIN